MKGKVVIVTGGSSGMGKYMAKRFAEANANIVITGRTLERLEDAKKEIETFPGQVLTVRMDVREFRVCRLEDSVNQRRLLNWLTSYSQKMRHILMESVLRWMVDNILINFHSNHKHR